MTTLSLPTMLRRTSQIGGPALRVAASTLVLAAALFAGGGPCPAGTVLLLLTIFIAVAVMAFAARHLRADSRQTLFQTDVLAFGLAVSAMALADDLVSFAVGWFLSGRSLVSLVGHVRTWDEAQLAARRCSRIFLLSDLFLIAGFGLVWKWSSGLELPTAKVAQAMPATLVVLTSALLAAAAIARCALPPFSHWLLRSLSAPTPVSALMHGGFVNAGGFLLIRFAPLLEAAPPVRIATLCLGLFAAIYGLALITVRPDIKGALAASTVSQMGFMIASCGLGYYGAALWHLAAHGVFKAWLFLSSGSSVGIERNRPVQDLSVGSMAKVAMVALIAGAGSLLISGEVPVPLLLAVATGLASASALRRKPRAAVWAVALVVAAIAGAEAFAAFIVTSAASPIDPGLQLAIAALFLGLSLVQRAAGPRALPNWLFAYLMNAAAVRRPLAGANR